MTLNSLDRFGNCNEPSSCSLARAVHTAESECVEYLLAGVLTV